MRSNVIPFKPYMTESGPDFSGTFRPDYLGISSKIQSHIFPDITVECDYAFWSGIMALAITRHWGPKIG